MQCYQWKNRHFLIPLLLLIKVLNSRRGCRALAKLLPLFDKEPRIKITYEELATLMGYQNRSGAHKAIKILERFGVVTHCDGYLYLTMGDILLKRDDDK